MGSKTAALPKKLQNAITERMRQSLLKGDTPFDKARLADAASFVGALAADRTFGRSSMAIESISDERRLTRIAIVNDDMPFIVDSVAATIAALGLSIDRLVHPVIPVERDDKGRLTGIPDNDPDDAYWESMIYIEAARVDAKTRRQLQESLKETLADVRVAVSDWSKLQQAMTQDADRIRNTDEEGADLLDWLNSGMLTQLGHVTRHRDGTQRDELGICRKSARELLAEASYERAFAWFAKRDNRRRPLIIKANHHSNVHRRVPLDLLIVPIQEGGETIALSVHAGVWTSAALAAPPRNVPRLRRELETLRERHGFDDTGHAGKALVHALTTLPHDLLIGFSESDVERVATTMMSLVDRPRPRLALVEAPLARHLFAFVWLPRDMVATQVRLEIQALLEEAAAARLLDWSLEVEGGNLATIRFVFDIRDGDTIPGEDRLEQQMQTLLRGWSEAVEAELGTREEPSRAAGLAMRFAEHFPTGFRGRFGPREAALDISRLHDLGASLESEEVVRGARMYFCEREIDGCLRLKLYQSEGSLPLSEGVPALEDFGFYVRSEMPTVLDEGRLGTIHDFLLDLKPGSDPKALIDRSDAIEEAIASVLNGEAENDPFNRLVPEAGLSAREANWLRAFYRYLRQVGMGFTIYTVVDALAAAPDVTRALIALFTARHDPDFGSGRDKAIEDARSAIKRGLAKVKAINDDRLLRLYNSLIDAILRTNAFAPAAGEALAIKIDSARVPGLPKPIPYREIFVYSSRVEGVHLRSGPVARGGLRWSDRRDDFRTEILGLMKAQRVKNAVIVPTGAKGGFYPKQLPNPQADRDAWLAEGTESYRIFIRALLSVTDNIVNDHVKHPAQVVVRDGDDPYFVVAADKGTATFSDVANGIALDRKFWLGDAFASGGSNGYDHKAMGITARGAWISVQRHFAEMGVDVQSEPISVVGCGDMSGDVFGNGMLLSKAIKLVAAFDHRHIFFDPAPDPARSWEERNRMFQLPRSSWDDYDKALISKGGGVFSRALKSITLTPEIQAILGVTDAEMEPTALISAILKAPADLLWFGGIGTYVKAAAQSHSDVGDPANDRLRVNAEQLRVKVIGEGANLGTTQAGRIAFSLHGGRINTDFIDNSAGVDCSDNEVNIKIALNKEMAEGRLPFEERNALLESMTDAVGAIVLEDNRLQALGLSIAENGGAADLASYVRLIETFEESGRLDRQVEGLAANDQLLRRGQDGQGLTRPELAVLLSTAKLSLQDAIEQSDIASDDSMTGELMAAFPPAMQEKEADAIAAHALRREIIATKVANRIVNRLGLIHPFEMVEEEGCSLGDMASAFLIAERLYDIDALWADIDAAEMAESARLALFGDIASGMRAQIADILRSQPAGTLPSAGLAALKQGVGTLAAQVDDLLTSEAQRRTNAVTDRLLALGAPEALARRAAGLFKLDGAVGIAALAGKMGVGEVALTRAFTHLGEAVGIDWVQSAAARMEPSDPWERLLISGVARDMQQVRLDFLAHGKGKDISDHVEQWLIQRGPRIRQFRTLVQRAKAAATPNVAMLAEIAGQARGLLGR